MAEPRRISLISTTLSLTPSAVKDPEPVATTSALESEVVQFISLSFDVVQPTEDTLPVYDFTEQVLIAEKEIAAKEKSLQKPDSDPFEVDDEEKLNDLAKHFEEKYGSGPRDFRDLGAGYDQNDPFVDDANAAETVIPNGLTTQHGGFYIGTGPLQVRPLQPEEEKTHVYQSLTADQCLAALKSFNALSLKRKRVLESSEDEAAHSTMKLGSKKKTLESSDDETEPVSKPRKKHGDEKFTKPQSKTVSASHPLLPVPDLPSKKNGSKTVASILARRGDHIESDKDMPTDLRTKKPFEALETAVKEPIMSVNTVAEREEKETFGEASSPSAAVVLPDEVPDSLRVVVDNLKHLAVTWEGGKCNFFSPEHNPVINNLLLDLEYGCRKFRCGLRSTVFSHMAAHLPCSKETLVKRARKLRQDDVDSKFRILSKKLSKAMSNDNGLDSETKQLKGTIRKWIFEAVRLKMSVYDLYRSKYPTHEDFIRQVVNVDLLPLWQNNPIEKEHIMTEAVMALADALRPRSHQSGMSGSPKAEPNLSAVSPPSISSQQATSATSSLKSVLQTNKPSKSTSKSQNESMPAPLSYSKKDSQVKVQYTTKAELSKEIGRSSTPTYGTASQRMTVDNAEKSSALTSFKPVFLPDALSSSFKGSEDRQSNAHSSSSKSRSSTPNSSSTSAVRKRPSSNSSIASLDNGDYSKRVANKETGVEEPTRTSSSKRQHPSSRQGDFGPSSDPRVLVYQHSSAVSNADDSNSLSNAHKNTKSLKSKRSSQSPLSVSPFLGPSHSHTSPFLPYNNPNLPLMVGQFTPESLYAMGLHPGYTNPFTEGFTSALMQNAGVFNTGGLDLGRPAQSSSKLRTSSHSSAHDSTFNPR